MFSLCEAGVEVSVVPRGGVTGEMVVVVMQLIRQCIEGSHVSGQGRYVTLYMANICIYLYMVFLSAKAALCI